MRNAALILLVCAGSLAAGVLWLLAGDGGARRGAAERAPEPSAPERVPVDEPTTAPDTPSAEVRQTQAPALAAALPEEPAFLGRVVDAEGAPVADARVFALRGRRYADVLLPPDEVLRRRPSGGGEARTGDDGRFHLPLAALERDADYRLAVRASGFAPLELLLTFRTGAQALGDLVLERGVRLSGVVSDSAGRPVEGAVLRSLDIENRLGWPLSSQSGEPLATSDEQGAFRIDQLASGPWQLLVTSERHPDALEEGETSAPGEVVDGLVFVLRDGLDIQGRVLAPGETLAEVLVGAIPLAADELRSDAPAVLPRVARAAADGSFTVGGLESGRTYRVAAWREAQQTTAHPDTDWVEVQGGARGVELVLRPERALVFQVVDAVSGAALVELEALAGCEFLSALADPDGRTRRDFPQGRVRFPILSECGEKPLDLVLSAPGHADRVVGEIRLSEGQTLDLGLLALDPVPTLLIHVVSDATGGPVSGAEVFLRWDPIGGVAESSPGAMAASGERMPWKSARTDGEGRARLTGKPGTTVLVRQKGFSAFESEPLTGEGAGEIELTFRLRVGGRVVVEVLDEHGRMVPSVWVRQTSAGSAMSAASTDTSRADREGRALFEHLEAGIHRFEVLSERGVRSTSPAATGMLTIVEGGEHTLQLTFPSGG